MSLPDAPLIAGTGGQYALIQRISASAVANPGIPAASTAASFNSPVIALPLQTGQGIQIRDASMNVADNDGTHHLTVNALGLAILNAAGSAVLCARSCGSIPGSLIAQAGTEVFGTDNWPFIAWNDFPQLGSSLAPNLQVSAVGVVANNDGAVPRVLTVTISVIFETWQAFQGGHVGFTR